ncbi:MAG: aldehyde dehydrogenase family protein, partial [Myxococcales bacterium]|nr:aldehyde dehydrogenase family protein [Myxococcales bacterium]
MERNPLRIGGELRDGPEVEVIRSPFDDQPVGEVVVAGERDMDDAIAIAHAAFAKVRALPTHARAAIAEATSRAITEQGEALAALMARESGKPIRWGRAEVSRAALTFALAAAEARTAGGHVMPIDQQPAGEGRLCLHVRVPRGPVAAISPFNFPLNLVAHKLAPAIAVGTTTVLKPPPQAPLTSHRLAALLADAGLPAGALSVLHCPPAVAQRMVEDDRMAVLSFTGSDAVGWRLKALAGRKPVMLELGGNAPCVIDRDVDLDEVMPRLLVGAWAHAGQVCIKAQRVLVPAETLDAFVARFVAQTEQLVVGDPLREDTWVGPLIDRAAAERVEAWIEQAVDAGARVRCGGRRQGTLVQPTILTDVPPDARVCRDEVFGPVTVVQPYGSFDDALAACNEGRFGLQAGV